MKLTEAKTACEAFGFARLTTLPHGSSKFLKSIAQAYNAGVSLAPARMSGHNVCPAAGLCRLPCVAKTGRAEHDPGTIKQARIGRTKMLFQDRETFMRVLRAECEMIDRKAARLELPVAFRPNTFSDLPWHEMAPWLFRDFDHWHIYGYTKVKRYIEQAMRNDLPANYHLTASYSERMTIADVDRYVDAGVNVAVPFYDRETLLPTLPDSWHGMRVIDGDVDDLRYLDPAGVIVGLRVKLPKNRTKSRRVIQKSRGFFVGV